MDWGDGRTTRLPSTATSATIVYGTGGNYLVSVTAVDEDGSHAAAPFPLQVIRPNQAPVAFARRVALDEGGSGVATLIGFDADGDALTFEILDAPTHGSLSTFDPVTRRLTYAPSPNFNGADSFSYRVGDGAVFSAPATVSFTVRPVNDRPVPIDDAYTVDAGQVLDISAPGLLGNDSDPDGDAMTVPFVDVTGTRGVVAVLPDGSFRFTPQAGFAGTTSFAYTVRDGAGGLGTARATVDVRAVVLQVSDVVQTTSGAHITFDRALDASLLNLYGGSPADITLVGATTGAVRGSLVLDGDARGVSFVKTGGPLVADTYTLRLRGGADGFVDLTGHALDGNRDGTAGDDYVGGFTVAPATGSILATIADFMRGPGQAVVVPNSATSTVALPIRLSNGNGVQRFAVDVLFDANLLDVQDVRLPTGLAGSVTRTAIPGGLRLQVILDAPLGAGVANIVDLVARIPESATYGAQQAIALRNVHLANAAGGALLGRGDVTVHAVGYFGDGTGDRTYTRADVDALQRIVTRADNGFTAWRNTDALIVGDIDGNGSLTSLDASRLLVRASGTPRPEIPALPVVSPPVLPATPARLAAPGAALLAPAASAPVTVDWSARLPDIVLPSAPALQTTPSAPIDTAWKATSWAKDLGARLKQVGGAQGEGGSLKTLFGQAAARNVKR